MDTAEQRGFCLKADNHADLNQCYVAGFAITDFNLFFKMTQASTSVMMASWRHQGEGYRQYFPEWLHADNTTMRYLDANDPLARQYGASGKITWRDGFPASSDPLREVTVNGE